MGPVGELTWVRPVLVGVLTGGVGGGDGGRRGAWQPMTRGEMRELQEKCQNLLGEKPPDPREVWRRSGRRTVAVPRVVEADGEKMQRRDATEVTGGPP